MAAILARALVVAGIVALAVMLGVGCNGRGRSGVDRRGVVVVVTVARQGVVVVVGICL